MVSHILEQGDRGMSKTIVYVCDRKGCGKTPAETTRITSDAGTYKVDLCGEHAKGAVEGATRQKRRAKREPRTRLTIPAGDGQSVDGG